MGNLEFNFNTVITCLQQKAALFSNLLDLSKKINIESDKDQISIDEILSKRILFISRIDKCNELINREINLLPEPEKEWWNNLLNNLNYTTTNSNEKILHNLVLRCKELCSEIIKIDKLSYENLSRERSRLQQIINMRRRSSNQNIDNILHS